MSQLIAHTRSLLCVCVCMCVCEYMHTSVCTKTFSMKESMHWFTSWCKSLLLVWTEINSSLMGYFKNIRWYFPEGLDEPVTSFTRWNTTSPNHQMRAHPLSYSGAGALSYLDYCRAFQQVPLSSNCFDTHPSQPPHCHYRNLFETYLGNYSPA